MFNRTIVVFHQGALAHYHVEQQEAGGYLARLQNYKGDNHNLPPQQFELRLVGRHWEDDGMDQELINEIGKAIELTHRKDGPVDHDRARNWGSGDPSSI